MNIFFYEITVTLHIFQISSYSEVDSTRRENMINKKNLWFLTLFSLILVLSVYYITMPSELLLTGNGNYMNTNNQKDNDLEPTVSIEESELITALRVSADEELMEELDALKEVLTNTESSVDEKNNAFEKMKTLNINKGEETKLEKKLSDEMQLKTFVKINGDQIKVVVDSQKHDTTVANNIMRSIQSNFDKKMYITVQFKG